MTREFLIVQDSSRWDSENENKQSLLYWGLYIGLLAHFHLVARTN